MWIQPMKFIHTSSVSHAPICVCAYHLVWIPVTFTTVKIKNLYHKDSYATLRDHRHLSPPSNP